MRKGGKSGRVLGHREGDISMTHHLCLLLPLLASVWGDADPWVDNDLYYGTVYQVGQDLVGEDYLILGFELTHPCIMNMTKKGMQ